MFKQVKKTISACRRKLCPRMALEEIYGNDDVELITAYTNIFVMIWTGFQVFVFLLFLILFLNSPRNEFMQTSDSCEATEPIYQDETGLPLEACSQNSCLLYEFTWSGGWGWFDDRPRKPEDGPSSTLFTYDGNTYCCNLQTDDTECTDFIPWRMSCGFVMWGSCLAAMCGMLMTQVVLCGLYGLFARRQSTFVFIGVAAGVFLRSFLFFLVFYVFFGFLFLFLFFWLGMMWCDNPYAWDWFKFGAWYVYFFYDNMVWVLTQGVTEWDGYWDMDTMVGTHIVLSTIADFTFGALHLLLIKLLRNKDDKKLFDMAFFQM